MLILGIETSCDETAAAVVEGGCHVRSNVVATQESHSEFGGVVPELAARQHLDNLPWVTRTALERAGVELDDVEGFALTRGPGLIGALLCGWSWGRGLAWSTGRPFVAVHHLAAHVHGALMPALAEGREIPYPLVALVVSGGHTSLYRVPGAGRFEMLGSTRDDAAGEAFDKVAALLGLGYPGGPVIDRLARRGDPGAFALPRADLGDSLEFSFSGLKTAVRRVAIEEDLRPGHPEDPRVADLAASFQEAAVDMLVETTRRALERHPPRGLVVAGGVAANRLLRGRVEALAGERGLPLHLSPPELSTDNAAMIAGAGHARLAAGEHDDYDLSALANWTL